MATDLRASFSLVVGGLVATGELPAGLLFGLLRLRVLHEDRRGRGHGEQKKEGEREQTGGCVFHH